MTRLLSFWLDGRVGFPLLTLVIEQFPLRSLRVRVLASRFNLSAMIIYNPCFLVWGKKLAFYWNEIGEFHLIVNFME